MNLPSQPIMAHRTSACGQDRSQIVRDTLSLASPEKIRSRSAYPSLLDPSVPDCDAFEQTSRSGCHMSVVAVSVWDAIAYATSVLSQSASLISTAIMTANTLVLSNAYATASRLGGVDFTSWRRTCTCILPSAFVAIVAETVLPLCEWVVAIGRAAHCVSSLESALPPLRTTTGRDTDFSPD